MSTIEDRLAGITAEYERIKAIVSKIFGAMFRPISFPRGFVVVPPGASAATLRRRVTYGGRKGRRAARRLEIAGGSRT